MCGIIIKFCCIDFVFLLGRVRVGDVVDFVVGFFLFFGWFCFCCFDFLLS